MVTVKELPIYDPPGVDILPLPTSVTSIEVVAANAINDYIRAPTSIFCSNRKTDLTSIVDFLKTPVGVAQVITIGGSYFVGRKVARKFLPVKQQTGVYTRPFIAANYAVQVAVPLSVTCAWFETPREWTLWGLKNTAYYSGNAIYYTGYYSGMVVMKFFELIYSAIAGFFGMIWAAIKGTVLAAWWCVKTTASVVVSAGSFLSSLGGESDKQPTEARIFDEESLEEPLVEAQISVEESLKDPLVEKSVSAINPSDVELHLATAKRHGEEENFIPLAPCKENCDSPTLEEDLGQSEDDDKVMYPSRRR